MPGIVQVVTLVVAAAAGVLLLDATIRRTLVGVGLVVVAAALIITFPKLPYGSFGGFNLSVAQWLLIAVALYFSTVEPKRDLLDRAGRAWMLLAAFPRLRWALQPFGLSGWTAGRTAFCPDPLLRVVHPIFFIPYTPAYEPSILVGRRLRQALPSAVWL